MYFSTPCQQTPSLARSANQSNFLKAIAMKIALSLISTLLVSTSAFASAELAEKKGCVACHAADSKRIGPSYKDVAAKYAGNKEVVATLAAKVVKGGGGVWGTIPMPANSQVTAAEAKTLVQWILTAK